MHKLQENVSLLVSLTSAPGALFNIFLKRKNNNYALRNHVR
jgi:hypothetical protein